MTAERQPVEKVLPTITSVDEIQGYVGQLRHDQASLSADEWGAIARRKTDLMTKEGRSK